MIKKLRFKFIIIAMVSLFIVLGSVVTAINVANYRSVSDFADEILTELQKNGGSFAAIIAEREAQGEEPPLPPDGENDGNDAGETPRPRPDGIKGETFFETRYFSVDYSSGTPVADAKQILLSESEAITISEKILSLNKTKGYYGNYRFLVQSEGPMVMCVDCTKNLSTAGYFLHASLIISALGYLCVFILVFIISGYTFKPVAESYDKQKKFITDAEHELKTPITIISANNELIEMEYGESESTRAISKQVDRLSSMVKNLVSLARLDETDKLSHISEFSASEVAEDCFSTFIPTAESAGKTFTLNIEKGVTFNGNKDLVARLFSIVAENACKYSLTYTTVFLEKKNKGFTLTVKNDAKGVKNGKLDRVFDRFYRADETRASGIDGSGIGLSVAKEIVSLHKGDIKAFGENGNFTVKINL